MILLAAFVGVSLCVTMKKGLAYTVIRRTYTVIRRTYTEQTFSAGHVLVGKVLVASGVKG